MVAVYQSTESRRSGWPVTVFKNIYTQLYCQGKKRVPIYAHAPLTLILFLMTLRKYITFEMKYKPVCALGKDFRCNKHLYLFRSSFKYHENSILLIRAAWSAGNFSVTHPTLQGTCQRLRRIWLGCPFWKFCGVSRDSEICSMLPLR